MARRRSLFAESAPRSGIRCCESKPILQETGAQINISDVLPAIGGANPGSTVSAIRSGAQIFFANRMDWNHNETGPKQKSQTRGSTPRWHHAQRVSLRKLPLANIRARVERTCNKAPGSLSRFDSGQCIHADSARPVHGFARKNSATRVGGRILNHGWADAHSPGDDHDPWTGTFWFGPGRVTVQRLGPIRNPSSDAGA